MVNRANITATMYIRLTVKLYWFCTVQLCIIVLQRKSHTALSVIDVPSLINALHVSLEKKEEHIFTANIAGVIEIHAGVSIYLHVQLNNHHIVFQSVK